MKSFYGRKNELKALEQIEKNSLNSANFTVITGRRRIGKTELLKKYIEKTDFDACLCPSFLFCYSYDALYPPTVMSLMYVSPSFVADKENHVFVKNAKMIYLLLWI